MDTLIKRKGCRNIIKKYSIYCMIICSLILSNANNVSANADGYVCSHGYYTFGDYTLNGGVGNYGYTDRYYWVDTSFSDTYEDYINKAVSKWVKTTDSVGVTTPISIVQTKTKSDSVFDFLKKNLDDSVLGQTSFYKHGGTMLSLNSAGALTQNYSYTYIKLDTSNLSSLSAAQRQATCSHELGHALGLSHTNTVPSNIMCQYGAGRTATRASKKDLKTINHLY